MGRVARKPRFRWTVNRSRHAVHGPAIPLWAAASARTDGGAHADEAARPTRWPDVSCGPEHARKPRPRGDRIVRSYPHLKVPVKWGTLPKICLCFMVRRFRIYFFLWKEVTGKEKNVKKGRNRVGPRREPQGRLPGRKYRGSWDIEVETRSRSRRRCAPWRDARLRGDRLWGSAGKQPNLSQVGAAARS